LPRLTGQSEAACTMPQEKSFFVYACVSPDVGPSAIWCLVYRKKYSKLWSEGEQKNI
jgi:hypothetical protein